MLLKEKSFCFTAFLILLCSCTEIYTPEISHNFSVLVVDGRITNENKPIEIKIYHTISIDSVSTTDITIPEKNAIVEIFNDLGDSDSFNEIAPGIYQNTSLNFRGEIGRTYWIKIKTEEGIEYESEPETMTPPVEITKIYGEEFPIYISQDKELESVKLYFDAKDEYNETSFLRWEALESWEWHCPLNFNLLDSLLLTNKPASVCFPKKKITSINLFDASSLGDKKMTKLPITFITKEEQKLLYDYYIQILVRSISFKSYHFWNHIKEINQASGNLFDRTPGNVVGNIFSSHGKHSVVGYFEVSSVSSKAASFNKSMYDIPFDIYPPECNERNVRIDHYPDTTRFFITRIGMMGFEMAYFFVPKECIDCSFTYSPNKPSFWQ